VLTLLVAFIVLTLTATGSAKLVVLRRLPWIYRVAAFGELAVVAAVIVDPGVLTATLTLLAFGAFAAYRYRLMKAGGSCLCASRPHESGRPEFAGSLILVGLSGLILVMIDLGDKPLMGPVLGAGCIPLVLVMVRFALGASRDRGSESAPDSSVPGHFTSISQ
jgi:hypothetical protein